MQSNKPLDYRLKPTIGLLTIEVSIPISVIVATNHYKGIETIPQFGESKYGFNCGFLISYVVI